MSGLPSLFTSTVSTLCPDSLQDSCSIACERTPSGSFAFATPRILATASGDQQSGRQQSEQTHNPDRCTSDRKVHHRVGEGWRRTSVSRSRAEGVCRHGDITSRRRPYPNRKAPGAADIPLLATPSKWLSLLAVRRRNPRRTKRSVERERTTTLALDRNVCSRSVYPWFAAVQKLPSQGAGDGLESALARQAETDALPGLTP